MCDFELWIRHLRLMILMYEHPQHRCAHIPALCAIPPKTAASSPWPSFSSPSSCISATLPTYDPAAKLVCWFHSTFLCKYTRATSVPLHLTALSPDGADLPASFAHAHTHAFPLSHPPPPPLPPRAPSLPSLPPSSLYLYPSLSHSRTRAKRRPQRFGTSSARANTATR